MVVFSKGVTCRFYRSKVPNAHIFFFLPERFYIEVPSTVWEDVVGCEKFDTFTGGYSSTPRLCVRFEQAARFCIPDAMFFEDMYIYI